MKKILQILMIALVLGGTFRSPAVFGQFFVLENDNIGEQVPDFTLNTLTATDVNLKEYCDGKNTILFFWATWCPHCRTALQKMSVERDAFKEKGIQVATVDFGENPEAVRKYVEKKDIQLDVFLDVESSLAEPYEIIGVPTYFFINKDGIVKDVLHELPENYEEIFG